MAPAEREKVILDAAERVLLSRGLPGTTMAAVAREAAMSKRTLYDVFDGRTALFSALIRRLRGLFIVPLSPAQQALPVDARLRILLSAERQPVRGTAALEILRAAVAEAPRHPDLAESFLREGPRAVRGLIRAELGRAVDRGEVALDDIDLAADLLHNMALPCPFEKLLGAWDAEVHFQELNKRVDLAITIFLRATAVANPPKRP